MWLIDDLREVQRPIDRFQLSVMRLLVRSEIDVDSISIFADMVTTGQCQR